MCDGVHISRILQYTVYDMQFYIWVLLEGHDVVFILQFSTEHSRLQRPLASSTAGAQITKIWRYTHILDIREIVLCDIL